MKNIALLVLFVFGIFSEAQSNYHFDYKLEYNAFDSDSEVLGKVIHFIPEKFKKNFEYSIISFEEGDIMLFEKGLILELYNKSLDNQYGLNHKDYYSNPIDSMNLEFRLEKMDMKPLKVLDSKCQYYRVLPEKLIFEESDFDIIFCIDESSKIDNASFLFTNQSEKKVKGLISAVSLVVDTDHHKWLELSKVSKTDVNIYFDKNKEIEDYYKGKEERGDTIDRYFDEVIEAAEKATEIESNNTEIFPYYSEYKFESNDIMVYAFDQLEPDSEYWKVLPKYCRKLDASIPAFSDFEIRAHARNYAAQICDLYLGEFLPEEVWFKKTIDEIRKEEFILFHSFPEMSADDKKLFNEFLNQLN